MIRIVEAGRPMNTPSSVVSYNFLVTTWLILSVFGITVVVYQKMYQAELERRLSRLEENPFADRIEFLIKQNTLKDSIWINPL